MRLLDLRRTRQRLARKRARRQRPLTRPLRNLAALGRPAAARRGGTLRGWGVAARRRSTIRSRRSRSTAAARHESLVCRDIAWAPSASVVPRSPVRAEGQGTRGQRPGARRARRRRVRRPALRNDAVLEVIVQTTARRRDRRAGLVDPRVGSSPWSRSREGERRHYFRPPDLLSSTASRGRRWAIPTSCPSAGSRRMQAHAGTSQPHAHGHARGRRSSGAGSGPHRVRGERAAGELPVNLGRPHPGRGLACDLQLGTIVEARRRSPPRTRRTSKTIRPSPATRSRVPAGISTRRHAPSRRHRDRGRTWSFVGGNTWARRTSTGRPRSIHDLFVRVQPAALARDRARRDERVRQH